MSDDEQQIRQLVADWRRFSQAGEVDKVLDLMTDDAVFLIAGRPAPMRKADFAAASKAQGGVGGSLMEGHSDIQEVQVLGDWAYMWTQLRVVVTPPGGAAPITRAGHTLTVLRKEQGRWRLARDANLLAVVPPAPA
jgi:uncharacterized protein (TIGR02246 family)